jgi:quinol monooxygenase YgiN
MSHQTIRVVARVAARPDTRVEVEAILRALVPTTRQEKGCISYQLLKNAADPCDFVFVEEWVSETVMQAHLTTPHIQKAFAQAGPLLARAPEVSSYSILD